ncbi:MAG: FHA domain-containing serine/threonine-protein kinase [Bacteroidales bacterium]|nr:FHA domain-containing serine/threonine-protein kinase [Bacteroidales bacterium]
MQVQFEVPKQFFLKGIPCRIELKVGQRLGDYIVEKILGSGTFGDVYKVSKNNKFFALKLLKLWEVVYKEQKEAIGEKFLREYHAGLTESDYLVHSHTFGEIEGNPFFIMDYISKGDLRSKIGKLSTEDIVMIGYDTLKGLRDLHANGIIHRDLKPDNVLLDENGKALLTDFGISAFINHRIKRATAPNLFGQVKETFGTYAYIAPEQMKDSKKFATTTPRTDIWSWGVMMYELFSGGEYPWGPLETQADLVEFSKNVFQGCFVHTLAFRTMPPNWANLIKESLQVNFDKRIESVNTILNILDRSNKQPVYNTISATAEISLVILQGVNQGYVYKLNGKNRIFNIGRSEINDIVIEDYKTVFISRQHFTIENVSSLDGWFIRDGQWHNDKKCWERSTNGTYINATEVDAKQGCRLKNGDIITIGDTTIKVNG